MQLIHGDCLEKMKDIPDKSIDMILCDLPYGTTACKWDTIIPFEPLWAQYKRLIKDNGAIVLTASQPFTSALVMSNPGWFKYEWIWMKDRGTNFLNGKIQPLRNHENILVFYGKQPTFNRQFTKGNPSHSIGKANGKIAIGVTTGNFTRINADLEGTDKNPKTVLQFPVPHPPIHPTQKPVALFEYLIRTYTNEGDTVLDNCAGSFTTAIACMNTNRKYICIEKDDKYFEIGKKRIEEHLTTAST